MEQGKSKTVSESKIEMHEMVLPNDTNLLGNLLGGRLMHLVDIAGAMAASRHANRIVATASIDSVDFHQPVKLGELVYLKARLTWVGKTSMEVLVEVFSEDYINGVCTFTNRAYLTFVSLDEEGKPARVPRLVPETDSERAEYRAAEQRRTERLKRNNR
ncbi:MAG: acyl-CoA thioesterase [Clostridiales bacterium 43-6]|nr:MAG: acyl-CoA thioesterase [Clostridiales bacterium 43-6]